MATIDKDLLAILICPESRQPLAEAGADVLARVNQKIRGGGFQNRGGQVVAEELGEGLVRADGKIVYPIRDGIPMLLVDEGLAV